MATKVETQARTLLGDGGEVTAEHVRLAVGYLVAERDCEAQVKLEGSRFDKRGRLTPAARAAEKARADLVKLKQGVDAMTRANDRRDERKPRVRPKVNLEQRRAEMAALGTDDDDGGVIEVD